MLIDCPTCSRSYHVDQTEIGGGGRMVICPRCQTRWLAGASSRHAPRDTAYRMIAAGDPIATPGADRPEPAARRRWLAGPVVAAAAGVLCLAVVLVEARETIAWLVPSVARIYSVAGFKLHPRGLAFEQTATARRDPASSDVVISGEIRNAATRRLVVPRLVYDIRDETGASLVKWTERTRAAAIPAGRVVGFASSPHHLPPASRTVLVTFDTDGDEVASR